MKNVFHVSSALLLGNLAKQDVHVLQRAALGLFEEEEHKGAHGHTEDAKHDEGLPADVVDSRRRDFGNDKVEQPLRGGSKSDTVLAKTGREDLERWTVSVDREHACLSIRRGQENTELTSETYTQGVGPQEAE